MRIQSCDFGLVYRKTERGWATYLEIFPAVHAATRVAANMSSERLIEVSMVVGFEQTVLDIRHQG